MSTGKHIFLCGFMGCGKSTQGKKLAALLRMSFTDLDQFIQRKEGKNIQFIFEHEGEAHFRSLESKYLNELIQEKNGKVVSLGGGTVCFNNNLQAIKENGVLIYIEMEPEELAARLKRSRQSRPLLKQVAPDELGPYITEKLKERNAYYKAAHLTVKGSDVNLLQLKEEISRYRKNAV